MIARAHHYRPEGINLQEDSSQRRISEKECYNCHKKGHISTECWAKGGGKEGQGPRRRGKPSRGNRAHQAKETDAISGLNEFSYMGYSTKEISKYDWLLDSGTTSHICTARDAFTEYYPLTNSTILGIGPGSAKAQGRGTVIVHMSVNGTIKRHQLRDVLHVPEAPNCLLSVSRLDDPKGHMEFKDGLCILKDKNNRVMGIGHKLQRLYLLDARAQLLGQERTNYASANKLSWDQWHRRCGHISMTSLQRLITENMVDGLDVNQSSIPSKTCESCIQAKFSCRAFPKEAENRATTAGEGFMSDVWGPAPVVSIGKLKYYISFTDDAKRFTTVLFLRSKDGAYNRWEVPNMDALRQWEGIDQREAEEMGRGEGN